MLRFGWSLLALVLILTACATYEVVQLPQRDADMYPLAQNKGAVAVAVDEISDPNRVKRYFGANLIEEQVLPVNITVSNHSEHRLMIKPADILLRRGREVIDPLPVEGVASTVKHSSWRMTSKTRKRIDEYIAGLALTEYVLASNETYHGVLFFEIDDRDLYSNRYFLMRSLYPQGTLQLHITLTDLETNQRVAFGPFSLKR